MLRLTSAVLLVAAATLSGCGKRDRSPEPPPVDPVVDNAGTGDDDGLRLVVLVVIDQLPSWSFERDAPYLKGGLARIIREGVYWPAARYPYASTYTSPGHAALSTGAPPAVTRILGNGRHDRTQGRDLSSIEDAGSPTLVIGQAKGPLDGVSGRQLAVDGVADVLRTARGGKARSVALGLKDRGAIYAAGKRPDLAIWYEPALAAFTTSRYYAASPPGWLVDLHREHPVSARFADEWTPLDAALLKQMTGNPDAAPGEGGADGLDSTFPHSLAGVPDPAEAILETPSGTDAMIEAALAAIDGEQLGADGVPDLLALTFSGHDYAGHAWGQLSWERTDLLLRLDRSLAGFLDALDARVGKNRWALVLASDHGAARVVEQTRAAGKPAHRLGYDQLARAADAAAARVLGKPGPWTVAFSASTVYLSPKLTALPERDRERAMTAMIAALGKIVGVAWAERSDRLTGDCATRTGREQAACLSLAADLSGEIYVQPAPDSLIAGDKYVTGTSHGSGNPDDTTVPIAVLAPGLTPRRDPSPVSPLRVAPTLSKLLGISPPPAAKDPPLF